MIRDLPGRDRHRLQADARKLQIDEIANLLDRADLHLRGETSAQIFRRHIRARRQHEGGGIEQARIRNARHADAELLVGERDRNRVLLHHDTERRAQRVDHGIERGAQGVVAVGRKLGRSARGRRERRQLAGDLEGQAIQLLGMQRRARGQMRHHRLIPVDDLKHQEVRDLRCPSAT